MFNRRKLLILLCILACVLLAGGFLGTNLLGLAAFPALATLYTEGWWTLLLIFPALTMFALDGYSRPALGLLAAGLLLFANSHGLVVDGMLAAAVVRTALAAAAAGAAVEITGQQIEKRRMAPQLADKQKKQLKDDAGKSPFELDSERPAKQPSARQAKTASSQAQPQPQVRQSAAYRSPYSRQAPRQSQNSASAPGNPPQEQVGGYQKGWDPSKTYQNPKVRGGYQGQVQQRNPSDVQRRQTTSPNPIFRGSTGLSSGSAFPQSVAIFGDCKINSNNQDLSGGIAISVFGDARLNLRDADYNRPVTVTMLSLFGSSRVEVPYVSNISISPISLFGECKDKRNLVNSSAMPHMTVRCIAIFGDCKIF